MSCVGGKWNLGWYRSSTVWAGRKWGFVVFYKCQENGVRQTADRELRTSNTLDHEMTAPIQELFKAWEGLVMSL